MSRLTSYQPLAYALFRIIFGYAFFTHGAAKLFGWFSNNPPVALMSEFGVAGVIETVAGVLIMVGLKANWAAFVASGEMAVAYFWKHAMGGDTFRLFHWDNRGEMVMLFCFAFLYIATTGSGRLSLDSVLGRKDSPAT